MKVALFHIRMTEAFQQKDQDRLEAFLARINLIRLQTAFVEAEPAYWSLLIFHGEQKITNKKISVDSEKELSEADKEVYKFLKAWRKDKGEQLNLPLYMICHNKELMSIAKARPKTIEELLHIKGFGEYKSKKFGEDIIVMINAM